MCTSDEFCEDEENSECREAKEYGVLKRETEQSVLRVARVKNLA